MSVLKNERKEGRLHVHVLARNHALYVLQITKNEKIFDPTYNEEVTKELVRCAMDIYSNLWEANCIVVNSEEDYRLRRELQERTIPLCNNMLSRIEIAHKLFHLTSNRIKYWNGMIIEIRNKIRAWINSDYSRYSMYHS